MTNKFRDLIHTKIINKMCYNYLQMGSYALWYDIMSPKFVVWREDYD